MKTAPWGRFVLVLCLLSAAHVHAQVLTGLTVSGPGELNEGSGGLYNVRAFFSNGLDFDVTLFSTLTVSPPQYGTITQFGQFTAGQVDQDEIVAVNAAFTWSGVTLSASRLVQVVDLSVYSCPAPAYQWGRSVGGLGVETVRQVHVDEAGSLLVVGSFEQTVDFNPASGVDQQTAVGGPDGYVSKYTIDGVYLWSRVFSGQGSAVVTAVKTAPDGAVYVVGNFDGTIDLDPGAGVVSKTAVGFQDVFVVKLNGNGGFLWGHAFGGTNPDDVYDVAVDHQGECVVAGSFQYTVDFDPGPGTVSRVSSGQRDGFALKLAGNGAFRWVYTFGNRQSDDALAVAVDPERNVYVGGRFSTTVDFDPGPGTTAITVFGVTDACLIGLNPDGLWQWVRAFGGPSTDGIRDLAVGINGDIIAGGYFWETVDFDPGAGVDNMTSAGQSDGFVCRFTSSGGYRWASRAGGALMEEVYGVAHDPEDRVLAVGYFNGTVDFNDGAGVALATSAGADDAFLAKYSSGAGSLQWVASFGGSQSDFAVGVGGNVEGTIFVAGTFRGTADLDPGGGSDIRSAAGGSDIFLSALQCGAPPFLDPYYCDAPAYIATRAVGGQGNDSAVAVATLLDGSRFVAGTFSNTVDLDPGAGTDLRTAVGGTDIYVSAYSTDGGYLWSRTIGGPANDNVTAIAVDRDGSVALVGAFAQTVDFDPGGGQWFANAAGASDAFVLRLTMGGQFVWARTVGGTAEDVAYGVAVDSDGAVVVAGAFENTADFNPSSGVDNRLSKGGPDIFIWKLTVAGDYEWAYTVGRSNIDEAYAVDIGRNKRILATGRFQSILDFDPGPGLLPLTAVGATDVFVLALESNGTPAWVGSFGGVSTEIGRSIACLASGEVAVAGSFWSTVDFDPGPAVVAITSSGEGDAFVVRLAEDGSFIWARAAGGVENDEAVSVAVDGSGNAVVTGFFRGESDFDRAGEGYLLDAYGQTDGFVWRASPDGVFDWAFSLGGTQADSARSVNVDQSGGIHVAGSFAGTAYLDIAGLLPVAAVGGTDAFAMLARCGTGLPDLCPGDLNCDGEVSFAEIDLFVFALEGPDNWQSTYPNCPWLNADCDGDGSVTFADIDPFVDLLGSACPAAPPAPVKLDSALLQSWD